MAVINIDVMPYSLRGHCPGCEHAYLWNDSVIQYHPINTIWGFKPKFKFKLMKLVYVSPLYFL
jgi:hypothetical protein